MGRQSFASLELSKQLNAELSAFGQFEAGIGGRSLHFAESILQRPRIRSNITFPAFFEKGGGYFKAEGQK